MPRDNATPQERIAALAPNQARIALMKLAEELENQAEPRMTEETLHEALDIAETYPPAN